MKLTIIIPCYNFEKYVKTCVDSILNQKLNFDFEVLIHDDQSTDKTFEVIKQLYSNKSNIIIS
jgi:glycosyltransferase involved in cell wall biosynthesis